MDNSFALSMDDMKRFLSQCKGGRLGEQNCIFWKGVKSGTRHDRFKISDQSYSIKKIAYFIVNNSIPEKRLGICLSNRNCINPPHLVFKKDLPETTAITTVKKKRRKRLEKEKIFKILEGERGGELDLEGINKSTLSRIKNKKAYSSIIDEYNKSKKES